MVETKFLSLSYKVYDICHLSFPYFFFFFSLRRFTSELAKKAKKVIAVDFMESFLKKNQEENGHMGNIEYIAIDVTKLEQPEER